MTKHVHPCPGGCGLTVPAHLVACKWCWRRLPAELREQVSLTNLQRDASPIRHARAVSTALQWYRGNPSPAAVTARGRRRP